MTSPLSFADRKVYALPKSLDDLNGPGLGSTLHLDHSIIWAPGAQTIVLKDLNAVRFAYPALLNEAQLPELEKFVNKDLLVATWEDLLLPIRVAYMWQERFPELPKHPLPQGYPNHG
ncbi:MAG: hypothetical protein ACTHW1_01605 [Ancrocorticia sp.]|uniref:hypothetical protein n=1 Tax=Ancrocorticia sp. TaxID=2593684 RepID=UPI003F8F26B2